VTWECVIVTKKETTKKSSSIIARNKGERGAYQSKKESKNIRNA